MARDRQLTTSKLTRAEGALNALLDCADLEMRPHFERALRAVGVNRGWMEAEAELNGTDPLADEAADGLPTPLTTPLPEPEPGGTAYPASVGPRP